MKRPLWTVCLCLAALLAVWLRYQEPPGSGVLCHAQGNAVKEGELLTVTGRVYQIEDRTSYGRQYKCIYLDSNYQNLICEVETEERPRMGSLLQVKGQFSYFSQATNQGQFNQAQYYGIMGIGGRLQKAEILAESSEYSVLKEGLYCLRVYWKERLYQRLPQKEAAVMAAMLLGDKTALDEGLKDLYQRNGIIHILSISGLHITVIGMGLYRLLRRLGCPVMVAAILGGGLLFLYGILTGMGVSACRAIGMYLIRMLGLLLGRTYDMVTALGVMAVIMLIGNPAYLLHCGFLLSYASVAGIGLLLPVLLEQKALQKHKKKYRQKLIEGLRQALYSGTSVTIFTLPIQLCFYYEVPVYSILLNMAVLPVMSIVLPLGLVVMLIPDMGILDKIAGLLGKAVEGMLGFYETMCELCDRLPFHTWTPGCPEGWQVAVFYGVMMGIIIVGKKVSSGKRLALLALAVVVLGSRFRQGFTVTFLDVGQGDCIVVQTGEANYLFDGGSSSQSNVGEYVILPYLKYCGISRLDGIFVSHPDKDHCSGVLELLEMGEVNNLRIEGLFLPKLNVEVMEEEMGELLRAAESGQTPVAVTFLEKGDRWKSEDVSFQCLHPSEGFPTEDANAYSLCFLVKCGQFSLLLTGDVEGAGEEALQEELKYCNIDGITVLKVAHHGSANSTPAELLAQIKPQIAVISSGRNNRYGHPHAETVERLMEAGSEIIGTAEYGQLTIEIYQNRVCIKGYLGRKEE